LSIDFFKKTCVFGLLLKIGPETSRIYVSNNSEIVVDKLPYDERNYYTRYVSLFFRINSTTSVEISSIREENRPPLLKGNTYEGRQSLSIAGVYTSNVVIPF